MAIIGEHEPQGIIGVDILQRAGDRALGGERAAAGRDLVHALRGRGLRPDDDERGRIVDERERRVEAVRGIREQHHVTIDRHLGPVVLGLGDPRAVEARHRLGFLEAVDHERAGRLVAADALDADRHRGERC
jgi:hypothetical protein